MRQAKVFMQETFAGILTESESEKNYVFEYDPNYCGAPISLTLPVSQKKYVFSYWPAFFDGLMPEGPQLEALLKENKIDRHDYFSQLMIVGHDVVGALSFEEIENCEN